MRRQRRTTKYLENAARYDSADAAQDAADNYNEERSPHVWGRIAMVMADRSEWPNQTFAVGIFATDTNVQTGWVS